LTLPEGVASLVESQTDGRHPGLLLDKFTAPGNQKDQRLALDAVCSEHGSKKLLEDLHSRRENTLCSLATTRLRATTTSPLTLHLARASALENAGIHLHPLYGFCCLPASGIKGMARAWAETAWVVDQEDRARAWSRIRRVFGWSPGSDRRKTWRPKDAAEADGSQVGSVVFHDAWPTTWPRLATDITNNHHQRYYKGSDDPGDWENPVPVYFLTVPAGVVFDFPVSLRHQGAADGRELLDLARGWVAAALCHAGAGAKTNAGHGRFSLVDSPDPPRLRGARRVSSHRLTLATPAFLAGARQEEADCTLRPATLRGLLRWWWRTMHTGHLGRDDLRRLETAIWGSAETGGALALNVGNPRNATPQLFAFKQGFKLEQAFAQEHGIQPPKRHSKTIQGLFYGSYGMDEPNKRRSYVDSGASWSVTLTARKSTLPGTNGKARLSADQVLRQGQAALWLLCRFGGVGSKARKGFGAFRDLAVDGIHSVDACKAEALAIREELALKAGRSADAPKLEEMMLVERRTEWNDAWFAVDKVGAVYQAVVKSFSGADKNDRLALGLPRRVGRSPRPLGANKLKRHSSPIHWSLSRDSDSSDFLIRFAAFPAPRLPDIETSRRVLQQAKERAEKELEKEARTKPQEGSGGLRPGRSRQGTRTPGPVATPAFHRPLPRGQGLPSPGDTVECVLLEERTKKGGWRAKHEESGATGPIQNTADVPSGVEPGQSVSLVVRYARPGDAAFGWPRPGDPQQAGKPKMSRPPRRGRRR
jgi:CRISPR-associated protein Cmr6